MFSSPSFFPSFPTHKVSQNLQPNSFKTLDILIASAFAIIFASQLDSVIVVYNCFLRKVIRQNDTDATSRSTQLEKVGCGFLREAYQGEGECFVS